MPTKKDWKRIHADLMARLGLPCRLEWSKMVKIGMHEWDNSLKTCCIYVNPEANFRVPEHLILHEAAHHRTMEPRVYEARFCRAEEFADECRYCGGHCEHWARNLLGMYDETGIGLPQTTGFEAFARAAGIVHKVFDSSEVRQMGSIADNPHLVEGA